MSAAVLALAAVLVAAPDTSTARLALVIGQNAPDTTTLSPLRYADDDAMELASLLAEAGVEVELLVRPDEDSLRLGREVQIDGAPALAAVDRAVSRLSEKARQARSAGARSELLFFFSGHGIGTDASAAVILEDGKLSKGDLYDRVLFRVGADQNHVLIDACRSSGFAMEKGAGGERIEARGFKAEVDRALRSRTGFVLSTSTGRESHEWDRFQAGVFSHQLRSALRGGADIDRDDAVSYDELGAFLTAANEAIANPSLRPDFFVEPPAKDWSTAVLRWHGSVVDELDVDIAAHIFVEDGQGVRIADVNAAEDALPSLRLPQKRPLFVRTADGAREWMLTAAGRLTLSAQPSQASSLARKGALHLALEKLFSVPLARNDVHRFREQSFVRAAAIEKRRAAREARTAERASMDTWSLALGISASAVAVASLGVGAALHVQTVTRYAEASTSAPGVERQAIGEELSALSGVAFGAYGAAAAATAAAVGSFLFLARPDEEAVADPPIAP